MRAEPAARLDLAERIYARLGSRIALVMAAICLVNAAIAVLPTALVINQYLVLTPNEEARLIVSALITSTVAILLTLRLAISEFGQMFAWSAAASTEAAPAAWAQFVRAVPRIIRQGAALFSVLFIPTTLYWVTDFGLPWSSFPVLLVLLQLPIAMGAILDFFTLERLLLPVGRDIARHLPDDFTPEFQPPGLRLKLLFVVVLVGVFTATVVASIQIGDLPPDARLAIAIGSAAVVTLTLGLLPLTFLAQSVARPVRELETVVARVEEGDMAARAALLGADEIGRLTGTFNKMLGQLQAQSDELRASRTRIIAASDAERRRVERNIHDGAQQQLVALALELRLLEARAETVPPAEIKSALSGAGESLSTALADLRELARGLHPQILTTSGLGPAVRQLASRCPIPVDIEVCDERFEEQIESTAYFVVSEALANVAKYSEANEAQLSIARVNGSLLVKVSDDGVGGADAAAGSGLAGLADRVAAVGGELRVESRAGRGTRVVAELALEAAQT